MNGNFVWKGKKYNDYFICLNGYVSVFWLVLLKNMFIG